MRSVDDPQAGPAQRDAASRWRVLGKAWEDNLAELRKDGVPFDLVVFTGDLADRGTPTDYPEAIAFLKETCAALDVPLERLFLVPGNHDIDRTIQPAAWESLRRDIATDPRAYSDWMAGDDRGALRGDDRRDQILERQRAFWRAVGAELGRPELGPWHSPHKRLGYRQAVRLPGLTQPIHVIGLDTAWLAGDEHDVGSLRLTERQVALLTATEDGEPLPGLRLALMHHRLADLADADSARGLLADRVDLLLHGHQHARTPVVLLGPARQVVVLAAGCLYNGDKVHRYLSTCQVLDLKLDEGARPRSAKIRFQGWFPESLSWRDKSLLHSNAFDGRVRFLYEARGWQFDDSSETARTGTDAPSRVVYDDGERLDESGYIEDSENGFSLVERVDMAAMELSETYDADEDEELSETYDADDDEPDNVDRASFGRRVRVQSAASSVRRAERFAQTAQRDEILLQDLRRRVRMSDWSWSRTVLFTEVRVGLGLLCAAQEAISLDMLAELAGWSSQEKNRFVRDTWALQLQEPASPAGVATYCLRDEERELVAERLGEITIRASHGTLWRKLATWPAPLEETARRYALRHALTHRTEAGDWADAWQLATDLGFLEATCRELGVHEVEADLARAAKRRRESGDEALRRRFDDLAQALAREANRLRAAPEATAALLWNRLRRSGWSVADLDAHLRVPAGASFLRIRHGAMHEGPGPAQDLVADARPVRACAVTADGRRVVSASEGRTLNVWDSGVRGLLATLEGHAGPVNACAVTADGWRVISASEDGTLKIWDLDRGRALATLKVHAGPVTACAVTADGRRVVSASADGTLKLWDLDSGRVLAALEGHASWVTACAVTADSQRVVSASHDRTLKVWDLDRGCVLSTLEGHARGVTACAVVDAQRVVSASADRTLKLWDLESGRALATLQGHADEVLACAVTANGRRVISASGDRTLKVWDLETYACLFTHQGDIAYTAVVTTPAGIVAGDASGAVWLLDWPSSRWARAIRGIVETDWGDPDPILRVVDGLIHVASEVPRQVGLEDVQRMSDVPDLYESLRIAEYLASERVGLLVAQFKLVGHDQLNDLPDEAVYGALRTGVLRDPQTGHVIDDWPKRVVLSYQTSAVAREEG
jgi:WD40 repeat protein